MKPMNLNQFMQDVHQNAIAHGWWDEPRSDGTVRSLFHCELSEAVEEYRANRPMLWHACPYHPGACETQQVQNDDGLHCEVCTPSTRKPEGAAVELMDFVIRVLDFLGKKDYVFPFDMCTPETLSAWSVDDFQMDDDGSVPELELPDFVDILHDEISLSSVMHSETYLVTAIGLALAWVDKHGLDPVQILLEKHGYNKTRSWKHGGKVC